MGPEKADVRGRANGITLAYDADVEREAHTSLPGHPDHVRECRDCGLLQTIPVLEGGSVAHCSRCNAVLRRANAHNELFPTIMATFAGLMFLFAIVVPFMGIHAPGHEAHSTIMTGPEWLRDRGFWPLSLLVFATLVLMPLLKLSGLCATLIGLRSAETPPWLGRVYRFTRSVTPWAMVEVFVLGAFIAYTRLGQLARVEIEPAMWALIGCVLVSTAAQATFDEEEVWDAAGKFVDPAVLAKRANTHIACHGCGRLERGSNGDPCLRCGAKLHVRKPNGIQRCWALLAAGTFLYIPANILPVMTITRFGKPETNTIISGVEELLGVHLVFFAILVFSASLVVPMMKLFGLVLLLVTTHTGSSWKLQFRTKLFRIIDAIGRWSMIDIFMLATLVALVHMGAIVGAVVPEWGAVAFAGVVVLTMFAAEEFDPRLMWDAAAAREKEASR